MSVERVKDKNGENIQEGDIVFTKYRGGSHEGEVRHTALPFSPPLQTVSLTECFASRWRG